MHYLNSIPLDEVVVQRRVQFFVLALYSPEYWISHEIVSISTTGIILLFVEILSSFRVRTVFVSRVSHCQSQQQLGDHYIPMINLSTKGLSTISTNTSPLEIKSTRWWWILIWQRKIWIPQFHLVYLTKDSNSLSGLMAMNGWAFVRSCTYNSIIHPFGIIQLPSSLSWMALKRYSHANRLFELNAITFSKTCPMEMRCDKGVKWMMYWVHKYI